MDASPSIAWIALAAIATLAALVQTARLFFQRASRRWVLRARVARAAVGEARAERLLARAGYDVLARQVATSWTMRANGEPIDVAVRADLLVAKEGRRYVAEVKTGREVTRVDHIATRRQLLEYRVAFDVDGVVLVDAESDRVVHVDVDGRAERDPRVASGVPGIAVVVLVVAAGVLGFVLGRP